MLWCNHLCGIVVLPLFVLVVSVLVVFLELHIAVLGLGTQRLQLHLGFEEHGPKDLAKVLQVIDLALGEMECSPLQGCSMSEIC